MDPAEEPASQQALFQQALEKILAQFGEVRAQQAAIEWTLVMFLPLLTASAPPEIAQRFLDSVRNMYPNGVRDDLERAAEAHANHLVDRIEAARQVFAADPPSAYN